MGKFEDKIKKMEDKLAYFEERYGYNNIKPYYLRKKIEIYKNVAALSHEELGKKLAYAAGEIEKLKSGYYKSGYVDEEKKLLNVLREKIKSDNKQKKKNSKGAHGSLVEFGYSNDYHGGMEC